MPIPEGYAQTNLIFEGIGLRNGGQCVIAWDLDSYAGSAAQLAEDVFDAAATELMDNLASAVTLTGVLAKFGPDVTGPSALFTGNAVGEDTAQAVSSAVSYLVHKHTALGGRAGKGRMYLPGAVESSVGPDGLVNSVKRAAVESDFTAFVNLVIADLATPVLLHGADSPVSTPTPITSFTVDSYVATQRRRQR